MRVKLQLVICNDEGHEETVTDVITLNKKALIGFQGRGRDEVVSPDLCHDLFL